jgi:hypothetical protein
MRPGNIRHIIIGLFCGDRAPAPTNAPETAFFLQLIATPLWQWRG